MHSTKKQQLIIIILDTGIITLWVIALVDNDAAQIDAKVSVTYDNRLQSLFKG
jgi:hypothetical protein